MSDPDHSELRAAFARLLQPLGGGYLRTPTRAPAETCVVCATACEDYALCYPCRQHRSSFGPQLADRTGFVTYAWAGHQTGRLTHGYKGTRPAKEHLRMVELLVASAVRGHQQCPGLLAGEPVTAWTVVPSTKGRAGKHPLHTIVERFAPEQMRSLSLTVRSLNDLRSPRLERFESEAVPKGAHVLVIDDTWVRGGHIQSAALAVRQAGAGVVSALVLARWLDPAFGATDAFITERLRHAEPDLMRCPWTGGACPG